MPRKMLGLVAVVGIAGVLAAPRAPGQNTTRPAPASAGKVDKSQSIWTLNVDPVDGRMHVRARIWWSKKKEVHIECDHADLQTQKGVFQASGKVVLSGDNFEGRCERLLITLHEDRLQMEGDAEVLLLKVMPTYYSEKQDGKEKAGMAALPKREHLLELKGAQLSLRWPELAGKDTNPGANLKEAKDPGLPPLPPPPLLDKKAQPK